MESDERLDALVAPLRADVVSGAAAVAKTAAEIMRRVAIRSPAGSLEELRWVLGEASKRVLEAQPVMAPLVLLVRNVLAAVESAGTVETGRHAGAAAADEFRMGLETRTAAVAARASEVLPPGGVVATMSSSSTVRAALLSACAARACGVVCFESRPMLEGRALATALARAGIAVTFAVDAAAYSLVPTCDLVLLGADSIGDRGVVNKIGSASIASAAARAGVPVYVLADESKLLPRGFPQAVDDDRPGEEVWTPQEPVRVWNHYFEALPLDHVTGVVTESGLLSERDLADLRSRIPFPETLRRWADGR
jgi:translation initiation factor 2B subunit (eIF-2B alpha/beta/delta family)